MSEAAATERRRGIRAIPGHRAWLALSLLLAVAVGVALVLLLLREPDMIARDGPIPPVPPPTEEMLAEVAQLNAEALAVSADLTAILRQVAGYDCPPGGAPTDRTRFGDMKRKAAAILVQLAKAVTG
jgi:hypothetical protein